MNLSLALGDGESRGERCVVNGRVTRRSDQSRILKSKRSIANSGQNESTKGHYSLNSNVHKHCGHFRLLRDHRALGASLFPLSWFIR